MTEEWSWRYNLLALLMIAIGLPVQPGEGQLCDLGGSVAVVVLTVHAVFSQQRIKLRRLEESRFSLLISTLQL